MVCVPLQPFQHHHRASGGSSPAAPGCPASVLNVAPRVLNQAAARRSGWPMAHAAIGAARTTWPPSVAMWNVASPHVISIQRTP